MDEKSKEKLLENSKSKISNNKPHKVNNIINNEYMNQIQNKQYYIPIKERYHRKNPKILLLNENKVKQVNNGYYRNNISQTSNNSFIKSRTTCNSIKKDKKDIINNYSYKSSDEKNNIYKYPSLHPKYQNRNNKIESNELLMESQTTKNKTIIDYQISLLNNNNKK